MLNTKPGGGAGRTAIRSESHSLKRDWEACLRARKMVHLTAGETQCAAPWTQEAKARSSVLASYHLQRNRTRKLDIGWIDRGVLQDFHGTESHTQLATVDTGHTWDLWSSVDGGMDDTGLTVTPWTTRVHRGNTCASPPPVTPAAYETRGKRNSGKGDFDRDPRERE